MSCRCIAPAPRTLSPQRVGRRRNCAGLAVTLALGLTAAAASATPDEYFAIHVVDAETGRGVPLVELRTTYNARYYTDSAGLVAFQEPGLMGQEVYFFVRSHGYAVPKDGFGYAGVRLRPVAGGQAEVRLQRINIAERLYRVTGAGVYRDSVLLGRPVPVRQPVVNGLVMGSDSVLTAVFRGRLFWIWGDTGAPWYPLGNFHATGATSRLPADGGLEPSVGVDLEYLVQANGFVRGLAPIGPEGAVWLDALVVLGVASATQPARTGEPASEQSPSSRDERMLACFARVRSLGETLERGFVEFNDERQQFEKIGSFDVNAPVYPVGHPLRVRVRGEDYFYFPATAPLIRVRADRRHFLDIDQCEAYTCLQDGTRPADHAIDRDAQGHARYAWRRRTPPLNNRDERELVTAGVLRPDEALLHTQDVETGEPVLLHGGSVYWNTHRHRWLMIAAQGFGSSMLGETWYFEADSPAGPWVYGRKIVTHDQYSFYNPRQHPEFDQAGGRVVYFEGTYSEMFSGSPVPTPWYDYNQIMYRLDLDDPRLVLPVAVYRVGEGGRTLATRDQLAGEPGPLEVAFFACDRPAPGLVAVNAMPRSGGVDELVTGVIEPGADSKTAAPSPAARPTNAAAAAATGAAARFYALPPGDASATPTVVALYAFHSGSGELAGYVAEPDPVPDGCRRAEAPVCRVWRRPLAAHLRFDPCEAQPADAPALAPR